MVVIRTILIGLWSLLFCASAFAVNAGAQGLVAESSQPLVFEPVCKAPAPYTSVFYGLDQYAVARSFHDLFVSAFRIQGVQGVYFVPVLRALNQEFRFNLDEHSYLSEIPEEDRMHYGLRVSKPLGLTGLPEGAQSVFNRFPEAPVSPIVGLYANALAATCLASEQEENERIATDLVAAKAPVAMDYHLLDWVTRLYDADCIGAGAYAALAPALSRRTMDSLDTLDPADHILALFMLIRAGETSALMPNDFKPILEQRADADEWDGTRSPIFGRNDVLLAGSYVLAHVLAQGHAGAPRQMLTIAMQTLADEGRAGDGTPMAEALEVMQLQIAMEGLDSCTACEPDGRGM